ncbi:MAG: flagellar motor stator protein MotA [Methylotenera sp.]|nr:flagellar motor stator protein MotA [Oligoflexia bacterium]
MLIIVGAIVVSVCVFGGFTIHGGNLAVLWQPEEMIIIVGAAIGSLIIQSPMSVIKDIIHQLIGALKGKEVTKAQYTEVLLLMYDIIKTAKGNPLSLESHVEKPEGSDIFKKYPYVLSNHHALGFICDTLKVQISSPVSPYDLEDLMDKDIETVHHIESLAPASLNKVSDAMPGLGIVAAVLGVVITMGKLTAGKEVIGHSVGAALVGTFIGILISYGFMGPLAAKMDSVLADHGQVLTVIKSGLLAFAKDCSPKVCVEFARRTIPPAVRPSFEEVDKATSGAKAAA